MLGMRCSTLFLVLWTLLQSLSPGQRPVQFLWHSTCYKRSYISISAYFWSFNGRYPRWTTKTMIQMWWCLKELWRNWINLLSTIVTHTAKAMICRISRLIRNAKRSSSIPIVLFLPSINRPLLKFLSVATTFNNYRTSNFRSCNNKKRIVSSLLIVLATSCVGSMHKSNTNL